MKSRLVQSLLLLVFTFLFVNSLASSYFPKTHLANAQSIVTTFRVVPEISTGSVGEIITIEVDVYDAADLWGWQVDMLWDPDVLAYSSHVFGDFLASQPDGAAQLISLDFVDLGNLMATETTFGDYPGVTADAGWLISIDFEVVGEGTTTIDIDTSYTYWLEDPVMVWGDDEGEMIKERGTFTSGLPTYELIIDVLGSGTTNPAPGVYPYAAGASVEVRAIPDAGWLLDHWRLDNVDVGTADAYTVVMDAQHNLTAVFIEIGPPPVASFFYSPMEPHVGEVITFDASASYDPDGTIASYEWAFGDGTTDTGMIVTHTYSRARVYVATLTVTDDDGFADVAETSIEVTPIRDVAITKVTAFPTTVLVGETVHITVELANEGSEIETPDVTVYYDDTPIVIFMQYIGPGETRTMSFGWGTGMVAPGTYTIKAMADVVPGETDTEDNTYMDGTVTILPRPVPCITLTPDAGPVGTKVTVNGSNFATQVNLYLSFDDHLIGFFVMTDERGNFTATFNVPLSEPGEHVVKAWALYYYPYEYTSAEATFLVVDTTPLEVEADVGALYFKGETAEFSVQTTFKGTPVDATSIHATLHKPDGTDEPLVPQRIGMGIYKVEYALQGKGSMLGTYTLVVEARYNTATINATGTAISTFVVKSPWSDWERGVPKIALSIATIAAAIGLIVVWRRENQKREP